MCRAQSGTHRRRQQGLVRALRHGRQLEDPMPKPVAAALKIAIEQPDRAHDGRVLESDAELDEPRLRLRVDNGQADLARLAHRRTHQLRRPTAIATSASAEKKACM